MASDANKRTGRKRGNNEGTIVQRRDGRWVAAVTLNNGKRKWLYGKTRSEVQRKLTATLRDVQQGLPVPTGRLTFRQYLERWLEDRVKPNVRLSTYRSYEQLVRVHIAPALGKYALDQVTPERIEGFLNEKRSAGLSQRRVQYLHAIIRVALNRAMKWKLVAYNAATLVDTPKVDHEEIPGLSPDEALAILDAMRGSRLEALVTVALTLGLRLGEALGLQWQDVNLETGTVKVRRQMQRIEDGWTPVPLKTDKSRRTLALPDFAAEALRAHRTRQLEERLVAGTLWEDYDLVFPSTVGAPWDGTSVTHQFQKLLKRATLPQMRFHDLRHGAASLWKAMGFDLRDIMEMLGHSQISLTANLYTHIAPQVKRDAARRMDDLFKTG